jgi:hypothetical protein
MAEKTGIKAEIVVEPEGEESAAQLEGGQIAFGEEARFAIAGADAEKREIAAADEGFELAAGVGDTIDLVEGVREVGDSRSVRAHMGRVQGVEIRDQALEN